MENSYSNVEHLTEAEMDDDFCDDDRFITVSCFPEVRPILNEKGEFIVFQHFPATEDAIAQWLPIGPYSRPLYLEDGWELSFEEMSILPNCVEKKYVF